MARRAQNLEKRGPVYYVRLRIPRDLQPRLGRSELRWSLKTQSSCEARGRALAATLAFERLCARLRVMPTLNDDQIRGLVATYHARSIQRAATYPPPTDEYSRAVSVDGFDEPLVGLRHAVEHTAFHDTGEETPADDAARAIRVSAKTVAKDYGIDLDALLPAQKVMLLQGLGRALIEKNAYLRRRIDNCFTPYKPADPFFADVVIAPVPVQLVAQGA